MTVFFSEVQSADTPPYNFLLPLYRPCASAVRGSAFPADQQVSQCVFAGIFALLGFCTLLLDFGFPISPCHFFLDSAEGDRVDDGGMAVLHIVFGAFPIVDFYLFTEAIDHIGFI